MALPSLGVLGVGHLATYTITGLRRGGDERRIILSPRNAERARRLVDEFGCEQADSNQAVVDQADLILLAVRPAQLPALLTDLVFPADRIVISAVGGTRMEALRDMATLPERVVRILPTVCVENGSGFVPVFPADPDVERLCETLGKSLLLDNENQFDLGTAMACLNGWLYRFMAEQTDFLEGQGMAPDQAREMVVSNMRGAADYVAGRPDQGLKSITNEIATEGTFTLSGIQQLEANQGFAAWRAALEGIQKKLENT